MKRSVRLAMMTGISAVIVSAAVPPGTSLAAPAVAASQAAAYKVTIYRDAKGVPHVFADNSAAVMFGAGYALAQDRLAAMELARRGAVGRRAEVLGPSAIDSDKTGRDRKLPDAELMRMYAAIPAEHQAMLRAFVEGINREIDEIAADPEHKTPIEFIRWGIKPTRWTLLDYLAYIASVPNGRSGPEIDNLRLLQTLTGKYGEKDGRRMFDDIVPINDPDTPTVIPAGEDLAPARPLPVATYLTLKTGAVATGWVDRPVAPTVELPREASRCLVIGPKKSASGNVLMMEATADGPEIHLNGGGFDTTGFAFNAWGPPFMGRGFQHGWLMTSGVAKANAVFAEKLNPANKYQYWYKSAWKDMEHHTETILVKGGQPVSHEVAWTVHGPVTNWDAEHGVAYSLDFGGRGKELDTWVGILEMGRAKSLAEFESKGVARLGWNVSVCYGGEDGQIAFWEGGALPKLAPGTDPRLPIPGTGEYDWTGFLSLQEKPHMLNPREGYFHSWNSKSTTWMPGGNDGRLGATYHTWQGYALAAATNNITLLDMRDFNGKIFNAMGARDSTHTSPAFFAPYIRAAIATSDDPEVKKAGELMIAFNGRYEDLDKDEKYDSPGLPLFRAWLKIAPPMIFDATIGSVWTPPKAKQPRSYPVSLFYRALQGDKAGAPLRYDYFQGKDRNAVLVETIKAAIAAVKLQFPGQAMDDWRLPIFWKYYDPKAKMPGRPTFNDEDDEDGPARLSAVLKLGPLMAPHNGGEGWVGLMELTPKRPALYSVIDAGGQNLFISPQATGNPNLTDQTMMHENNELKKTPMVPADVRAAAVSTTMLEYKPRN